MFPAERIKELRELKEITQTELARSLLIGRSTMSEYENGVKQPPVDVLIKMADFFGVSLDYLAGRTNIKFTVDTLQKKLVTQSGNMISIDKLVHLKEDEKELIGAAIQAFHKYKSSPAPQTKKRK